MSGDWIFSAAGRPSAAARRPASSGVVARPPGEPPIPCSASQAFASRSVMVSVGARSSGARAGASGGANRSRASRNAAIAAMARVAWRRLVESA